jgi:hypothetical protein
MKRSEMIQQIARLLYDNQFKCSMMQIYPIAEKLLNFLEEKGVSPPKTMISDEGWVDDGEGGKYLRGKTYCRAWEKENE